MKKCKIWIAITLLSIASTVGLFFHYEAVVADEKLSTQAYYEIALDYQITIMEQTQLILKLRQLLKAAQRNPFRMVNYTGQDLNYYMLPKNEWEEKSLNNGNFYSDRNIFGGTIYVKRLRPGNTTF